MIVNHSAKAIYVKLDRVNSNVFLIPEYNISTLACIFGNSIMLTNLIAWCIFYVNWEAVANQIQMYQFSCSLFRCIVSHNWLEILRLVLKR